MKLTFFTIFFSTLILPALAQDTTATHKWWINAGVGIGYYSGGRSMIDIGADLNRSLHKKKNLYIQAGLVGLAPAVGFNLQSYRNPLAILNVCIGKRWFINSFCMTTVFVGPAIVTGPYFDQNNNKIKLTTVGIDLNGSFIIRFGKSGYGIGLCPNAIIGYKINSVGMKVVLHLSNAK